MNNDIPVAKIKMMKGSFRCFIFGLLGLLPIIGLPFALAALWVSGRARAKEELFWNAARPYRIWGVVCAASGALVWSLVDIFLIYRAFNNYAAS
jgi:cadmium resistance protein CadD (predicted permease)